MKGTKTTKDYGKILKHFQHNNHLAVINEGWGLLYTGIELSNIELATLENMINKSLQALLHIIWEKGIR